MRTAFVSDAERRMPLDAATRMRQRFPTVSVTVDFISDSKGIDPSFGSSSRSATNGSRDAPLGRGTGDSRGYAPGFAGDREGITS